LHGEEVEILGDAGQGADDGRVLDRGECEPAHAVAPVVTVGVGVVGGASPVSAASGNGS
jgi:hypothetical protein